MKKEDWKNDTSWQWQWHFRRVVFFNPLFFKMSKCFLPYLIYMIHPLCVISFCSFFCVEFVEFVFYHFQVPNQKFTSSSQDLVTKKWPSMEQSCYVPCFSIMTNLLMDDWSSNVTHFLLLDNFVEFVLYVDLFWELLVEYDVVELISNFKTFM